MGRWCKGVEHGSDRGKSRLRRLRTSTYIGRIVFNDGLCIMPYRLVRRLPMSLLLVGRGSTAHVALGIEK